MKILAVSNFAIVFYRNGGYHAGTKHIDTWLERGMEEPNLKCCECRLVLKA